jgi:hypothetical protein
VSQKVLWKAGFSGCLEVKTLVLEPYFCLEKCFRKLCFPRCFEVKILALEPLFCLEKLCFRDGLGNTLVLEP